MCFHLDPSGRLPVIDFRRDRQLHAAASDWRTGSSNGGTRLVVALRSTTAPTCRNIAGGVRLRLVSYAQRWPDRTAQLAPRRSLTGVVRPAVLVFLLYKDLRAWWSNLHLRSILSGIRRTAHADWHGRRGPSRSGSPVAWAVRHRPGHQKPANVFFDFLSRRELHTRIFSRGWRGRCHPAGVSPGDLSLVGRGLANNPLSPVLRGEWCICRICRLDVDARPYRSFPALSRMSDWTGQAHSVGLATG